jgi:nucleotide-binding universal stress UspA family protein
VTVISAVQPVAAVYASVEVPASLAFEQVSDELYRSRRDFAARHERSLRERGLVADALVVAGDPRTEIVDAARREHADLVVVGSHGRTGLDRLVLGSVASFVVSHAPCSVLVVKPPRQAEAI